MNKFRRICNVAATSQIGRKLTQISLNLRHRYDIMTTNLRRNCDEQFLMSLIQLDFALVCLRDNTFGLPTPHGKLKRTNGTVVMDLCTCFRKTLIHARCLKMSRDVPNFRICLQGPLKIGMNSHTILQSAKKARQRIGSAYSYSCISKIYLTLNMGFRYQK